MFWRLPFSFTYLFLIFKPVSGLYSPLSPPHKQRPISWVEDKSSRKVVPKMWDLRTFACKITHWQANIKTSIYICLNIRNKEEVKLF